MMPALSMIHSSLLPSCMSMPVASAAGDDFGHGSGPHCGVQPVTPIRASSWPVVAHTALFAESHAVPPAQNGNGNDVGGGSTSGAQLPSGVQVPWMLWSISG